MIELSSTQNSKTFQEKHKLTYHQNEILMFLMLLLLLNFNYVVTRKSKRLLKLMLEVKITLEEVRTRLCHGHHGCFCLTDESEKERIKWHLSDISYSGRCLRTVGSNSATTEKIWGCSC
jgi:hypothetical protein